MSVLAEFLNREADRLAAERPTREAELAEWRESVETLFRQLTGWIKAADPKGVLATSVGQTTRREQRLGVYTIPTLSVTYDGGAVSFVPRNRGVVGRVVPTTEAGIYHTPTGFEDVPELRFEGLVDLTTWGRVAESFYRIRLADRDVWLVSHPEANAAGSFRFAELTQPRFERLLVRELQ